MTRDRRPAPTPSTPSSSTDFAQGRAHVRNAREAERRATEKAAEAPGKPAPEGRTPGGVSS